MTATAYRSADTGRLNVHGANGRVIATVDASRSRWLGVLLAECDAGHCYVMTSDMAGCPVCEAVTLETRDGTNG